MAGMGMATPLMAGLGVATPNLRGQLVRGASWKREATLL